MALQAVLVVGMKAGVSRAAAAREKAAAATEKAAAATEKAAVAMAKAAVERAVATMAAVAMAMAAVERAVATRARAMRQIQADWEMVAGFLLSICCQRRCALGFSWQRALRTQSGGTRPRRSR